MSSKPEAKAKEAIRAAPAPPPPPPPSSSSSSSGPASNVKKTAPPAPAPPASASTAPAPPVAVPPKSATVKHAKPAPLPPIVAEPEPPVSTEEEEAEPGESESSYALPEQATNDSGGSGGSEKPKLNIPAAEAGPDPFPISCPVCGSNIMTETVSKPSKMTFMYAAAMTLCCLCFVPFYVDKLKDIDHRCPNCRTILGTFKRG